MKDKAWSSEDGNEWFIEGHVTPLTMFWAAYRSELDVAGDTEALEGAFSYWRVSHYYVAEDPENEERVEVVSREHPRAEPMTWGSV